MGLASVLVVQVSATLLMWATLIDAWLAELGDVPDEPESAALRYRAGYPDFLPDMLVEHGGICSDKTRCRGRIRALARLPNSGPYL